MNNKMAAAFGAGCKQPSARRLFWLGAALLVCAKLGLTAFQLGYTWVGGAPLDDELMFRAANALTNGQWLGGYDYLTLSKSMGFAFWLALLHRLHLPYLIGGQLLWCAAALAAALALAPVVKRWGARLVLFGALVFLPSASAHYTLRVYRDNIFPALCLLAFAGFAGAALRAAQPENPPLAPWLALAGVGLAAGYVTREDAGLFLLPFAVAGSLVILVTLATRRRFHQAAWLVLPYALLGIVVNTICIVNNKYYGVYALSDFSTGAFADAMGAMARVESEAAGGYTPLVGVPADVRQKLYDAVPALKPLAYWLEEDAQLQNDFRDPALGDYRAGSFYWAIRRAAQFEGIYADAPTAERYWAGVAEEINRLCDEGVLPARGGRRSGTTPPIRAAHIAPVLAESAKSALWALTFQDCAAVEALRSIGTTEDIATWQAYLGVGFNSAAEAGKDTPYYSPLQKLAYGVLGAVRWVYALALPVLFAAALFLQFRPRRLRAVWRGSALARVTWLLLFGFLGMAALRCGMIAFMEVSSFGIGTSTMYLATVHPLLLLYGLAGVYTGIAYRAAYGAAYGAARPAAGKEIADGGFFNCGRRGCRADGGGGRAGPGPHRYHCGA
ncbi:MAG: hypothetical protein PHO10_01730 [Gemmiger sp.]|nr:hypothetical protein [Gemmiger sp.]